MSPAPVISVIIVNWNVRDTLRENLTQLLALQTSIPLEIIVVDNGSQDGSVAMLREQFPQVHRIRNHDNRGFAFACNQGLAVAQGEIVVLLNPDMLVGQGVIEHTVSTLSVRPEIGVMGVSLKRPDGTRVESVRRDPGFVDQLAILLKLPHVLPGVVARYLAKDFDYEQSQEVEQVRGSYFAFRRDVVGKIGNFDAKRFFLWFEEVDFCKRVRQAGLKVWYSADVTCTDLVGQSFKQVTVWRKQAMLSRSMARYFWKWHPAWQAVVISTLRPGVIAVGLLVDSFKLRSKLWK